MITRWHIIGRQKNGFVIMPISVCLNHAVADGYLVTNVFRLIVKEISNFVKE